MFSSISVRYGRAILKLVGWLHVKLTNARLFIRYDTCNECRLGNSSFKHVLNNLLGALFLKKIKVTMSSTKIARMNLCNMCRCWTMSFNLA